MKIFSFFSKINKKILLFVSLFLIFAVSVGLLLLPSKDTPTARTYENNTQYTFDSYTNELFSWQLSSDWLSMHFYLEHPEDWNIDMSSPTLGEYSHKSMKESQKYYINQINYLKSLNYKELYPNQQLAYDTLISSFTSQLDFGDLCLCSQVLSPTTGLQAQFPVLLSEYAFNSQTDIEHYLTLLSQVKDYFSQICEFQIIKAKNDSFISSFCCDKIIAQCKDFINEKNIKENLLYTSFYNRISDLKFLSSQKKKDYVQKNQEALQNSVIPGYRQIISTLSDLKEKGYCKNEEGLCKLKNGKSYYEYLVRSYTGSSRNILEQKAMIQTQLAKDVRTMYSLLNVSPELEKKFSTVEQTTLKPEEILKQLSKKAAKDFPVDDDYTFTIKYVDKSLENHLSPAFYMSPPIDSDSKNTIYINNASPNASQSLFTTLAHEGIPGHMFQSDYFSKTNPLPIRHLLNFGGYSEGWATYTELLSYQYAYDDAQLASAYACNSSYSLALYSLCDIGVNYEGWSRKETIKFLSNYSIEDESVCNSIFEAVVEEPVNYLQYYVGYLEIVDLKNKMLKKYGPDFHLKDFHKAFLSVGPTSFDVVEKWICYFYEKNIKD